MLKTGATLGGEQSGHILFRDGDATTGDGLLTALRVMEIMARSGRSLAELVADLKVFPQTIQNVRVREKVPFQQVPEIQQAIVEAEQELDGNGRVVVRYSGTEPLARVMVEAEREADVTRFSESLAAALRSSIGTESFPTCCLRSSPSRIQLCRLSQRLDKHRVVSVGFCRMRSQFFPTGCQTIEEVF